MNGMDTKNQMQTYTDSGILAVNSDDVKILSSERFSDDVDIYQMIVSVFGQKADGTIEKFTNYTPDRVLVKLKDDNGKYSINDGFLPYADFNKIYSREVDGAPQCFIPGNELLTLNVQHDNPNTAYTNIIISFTIAYKKSV